MRTEIITKLHSVIMLPAENASMLLRNTYKFTPEHGNPLSYEKINNAIERGYEPQHLYFISDEPIKEGEISKWCVNKNRDTLYQIDKATSLTYLDWDKVIATINPDLWIAYRKDNEYITTAIAGIPKIDTSFIEAYVREQSKIDTVLLEYELVTVFTNGTKTDSYYELKLKPKNGSVIVHPVKEKMYNREEVTTLCINAFLRKDVGRGMPFDYTDKSIDKWLGQNL